MKTKIILTCMALSIFTTGCTVGRYVTNVTSSGPNKIAVEKCTTKKWDMFFCNTECSTTSVKAVTSE